jgi:hypothetical protein
VTALAFAGIAMFAIVVLVVAIGMSRQAVHYVRDVRRMIRAGTETNVRDESLEDVLEDVRPRQGPRPEVDPRALQVRTRRAAGLGLPLTGWAAQNCADRHATRLCMNREPSGREDCTAQRDWAIRM